MSDNEDDDSIDSNINIIRLSHQINGIMLNYFSENEVIEILIHCVGSIIMIPRFELISTIYILSDYMLEKNKFNEEFNKNVNNNKKQAETWILSGDNHNFCKIWNNESKEVPEKIQEMYIDTFELDIGELIEKYITDFDEFRDKIEDKQKYFFRKWLTESSKEVEKIQDNLETMNLNEIVANKKNEEIRIFDTKLIGGKTFKERQKEQEEAMKPQLKESKKMDKLKKLTNLKYMDSIQEVKKGDKERFRKIFHSFEKEKNINISEETKNMLIELWYGNYFIKEQPNSDDILSIVKHYGLHFKISNEHINGEVNRLILQTYIIGLYIGVTIFDIYTIINDVLEANPTMSVHKIMPSMIHDGNVPNLKVQEVLNPIIKNLPLSENQYIIRENWNKLRFPNIDISELIEYLKHISMDNSLRFKISCSIGDLSEKVVTKGLTLEGFSQEVFNILKSQTMKIPITKKMIRDKLRYE